MTLSEAIIKSQETGRRFKRKSVLGRLWYFAKDGYIYCHREEHGEMGEKIYMTSMCSIDEFLATDWELEPVRKNVSSEEIRNAMKKLEKFATSKAFNFEFEEQDYKSLLTELGFEE